MLRGVAMKPAAGALLCGLSAVLVLGGPGISFMTWQRPWTVKTLRHPPQVQRAAYSQSMTSRRPRSRFDDVEGLEDWFLKPLASSNFLALYRQTPKIPKEESITDELLMLDPSKKWASIFKSAPGDVGQKAVYLWTTNEVYHELNKALQADDTQRLQHWILLVRAINSYITSHPMENSALLFRGTMIKEEHANRIEVGMKFRVPRYVATSRSHQVAKSFCKTYMLRCHVSRGCCNAADIAKLSMWPREQEVLLPPYTPFEVLAVDHRERVLEFRILDGKIENGHTPALPSKVWASGIPRLASGQQHLGRLFNDRHSSRLRGSAIARKSTGSEVEVLPPQATVQSFDFAAATTDVAVVQQIYAELKRNAMIRELLYQLQTFGDFSGSNSNMASLKDHMLKTNAALLQVEDSLARVVAYIGSMQSAWRAVHQELQLGPIGPDDLKSRLRLDRLCELLQGADLDITRELGEAQEFYEFQLENFNNQFGLHEEEKQLRVAQEELDAMRKQKEQLGQRFQEKKLEIFKVGADIVKYREQLVWMARKAEVAGRHQGYLKTLERLFDMTFRKNSAANGANMFADFITFGFGGRVQRAKTEEKLQQNRIQRERELFETQFADVNSASFAEKQAELESTWWSLGKQKILLEQQAIDMHGAIELKTDQLKRKENEQRDRRANLQSKLASAGTVSVDHYCALLGAVQGLAKQKQAQGNRRAFVTHMLENIKQYHSVVNKVTDQPHKVQLKWTNSVMANADGIGSLAPGLSYAGQMLGSLSTLLAQATDLKSLPEIKDLTDQTLGLQRAVDSLVPTSKLPPPQRHVFSASVAGHPIHTCQENSKACNEEGGIGTEGGRQDEKDEDVFAEIFK